MKGGGGGGPKKKLKRGGGGGGGGGGALNKVINTGRLCSKFRPKFCQNFHF